MSVSGLRKIRLNAYTLRQISTKNHFPKKPGLPLSTLLILDWYPYVYLFPDFLCNIGLSVSGLRKIRFNAYTLHRIATKNQFPKKPGFLLSALIILYWSNVDLLFKTEHGKIRIMSNKVYLAISKCATITCRDRKKLRKLEYVSALESILMKVVSHDFPNKSGVHNYGSLFPDLLCNISLSVTGLRKICFNAYTLHRISTKNQFPKKPGLPLSTLIILDWYPYVYLFPDLLCNIALSVSGLRKIRLNAYTLCRISTKNQFTKKPGFPLSMYIILACGNNNGENGRNLRS